MTTSKVSGRIVDRQSKDGIEGALVIVLKPGISTAAFVKEQKRDMALSSTRTGQDGRFDLPEPLATGTSYSLIIVAREYQDEVIEDGLRVSSTSAGETKLAPIRMVRSK